MSSVEGAPRNFGTRVMLAADRNMSTSPITFSFVIIGLLWDVLLRVGQSQAILNIGSLTLGFCVIYYYLHQRENTMMLTAATLGAVSGIAVRNFAHEREDEQAHAVFEPASGPVEAHVQQPRVDRDGHPRDREASGANGMGQG